MVFRTDIRRPNKPWLTITDLAAAVDRDKALISRWVAKYQIKTRPGPGRSKLIDVAEFLRTREEAEFDRNAAECAVSPATMPRETYGRAPWRMSGNWNRKRLEKLSARQERRNDRRRRRPSI